MVTSILDGIELDHDDYSDVTEHAVRDLIAQYDGVGISKLILDATDVDTDPARVARLFDISIWFPGIDILDFATELRRRLDADDDRTLQYVSLMDACVPDADDPLCWMIQTFPELAGLA
ncbi:MAG: hypothetical protein AAFX06_34425 [Planctomycetota bacterium]